MNEVIEQIERFQNLRLISPQSKCSSYGVTMYFELDDNTVELSWGCYDIGDYPRHYETRCKYVDLVDHMKSEIDKMVEVLAQEESE